MLIDQSFQWLFAVCVMVVSARAPLVFAQGPLFTARMSQNGFEAAGDYELADINGDGLTDLISLVDPGSRFSIEYAREDGTYAEPVYFETGNRPYGITAADYNADGLMDIATVLYVESYICIHLNHGDGGFAPRKDISIGKYLYFDRIQSADINSDGLPDLIASDSTSPSAITLKNLGGGLFQAVQLVGAPGGENFVLSDLNADGLPDFIAANSDSNLLRYSLNLGNFEFTIPVLLNDSDGETIREVAACDMDGDGDTDLVSAGDSLLLWRAENGQFGEPETIGEGGRHLLLKDLDGDHAGEVISEGYSNLPYSLSLLHNDGAGTSFSQSLIPIDEPLEHLYLRDMTGDGIDELVLGNHDKLVQLIGLGNGEYESPYQLDAFNAKSAQAADIDLDGDQDLVACAESGIAVYRNDGKGMYTASNEYEIFAGVSKILLPDLNADGYPDIVAIGATNNNKAEIMLNDQGDGFLSRVEYQVYQAVHDVVNADFDGDGDADLAFACDGSMSGLLRNNGDGVFGDFEVFGSSTGADAIAVADLDADGDLDIILTSVALRYPIMLINNGTGVFSWNPNCCGEKWVSPPFDSQIGDMNNDAVPDLVTSFPGGRIGIMFFDELGNTHQIYVPGLGSDYVELALNDIDLDGDLDILVLDRSKAVRVFYNSGNGSVGAAESYSPLVHPYSFSLADLNQDGAQDLIVSSTGSDAISLMLNRLAQSVSCPADLTNDGVLNFFDISAFLTAYLADDPAADFTNDSVLNFFDVSAFLVAFNAGCP